MLPPCIRKTYKKDIENRMAAGVLSYCIGKMIGKKIGQTIEETVGKAIGKTV